MENKLNQFANRWGAPLVKVLVCLLIYAAIIGLDYRWSANKTISAQGGVTFALLFTFALFFVALVGTFKPTK